MPGINDKPFLEAVPPEPPKAVLWKVAALCVVSAAGNTLLNWFTGVARLPLFLDTLFTIAVTISAGFCAGLGTGILCYPLANVLCSIYLRNISPAAAWAGFLFIPCTIIEIMLVWMFRAKIRMPLDKFSERPSLSSFSWKLCWKSGIAVPLLLLIAVDCIAVSVAGGIIDTVLFGIPASPQQDFSPFSVYTLKLGLLRTNMPFLAAAILARIPINIVDRFIVISGGYGVSIFYRTIISKH
jgi:hypothetical protein